MMKLKVGDKEYKIKFRYNSFCGNDLMERVKHIMNVVSGDEEEKDGLETMKDVFLCVRDLFYEGFQKFHGEEITSVEAVGDILDDYNDESEKSIMEIFGMLTDELLNQGFLKGFMEDEPEKSLPKEPQDHKKKKTKTSTTATVN